MGIREMKWSGMGKSKILDYSGMDNNQYQYGVALILEKDIAAAITHFVPISNRILLIDLKATLINIFIIHVFTPIADISENEKWSKSRNCRSLFVESKK